MPEFSQELFDRICDRIAGGESLRTISRDPDMPSRTAFFKWLNGSDDLVDRYTRAREAQADAIFDECLDIADQYDTAAENQNPDHIQRARLRIDTRKWMAGKMRPKKYGDKLDIEHTGLTIKLDGDTEKL